MVPKVSHATPFNATVPQPLRSAEFPPGVFFIGTDTGVGKTHVACLLAKALTLAEFNVGVYKPVASGIAENVPSDPELLFDAAERRCQPQWVCPQMFSAPLAPPIAAQLEGKLVDETLLVEGAKRWKGHCDYLIVESAGGGLSPISQNMTSLDLAAQLRLPLLLVVADRLGAVNHTLLTVEAAERRGLAIAAIVLNRVPNTPATEPLGNRLMIQSFTPKHNCLTLEEFITAPQRWLGLESNRYSGQSGSPSSI